VSPNATPLSGQVASLRRDLQAIPAPAWVPSAIHALILACLTRIIGRLEDLVALWEAGKLPAFPEPTPRTRTAAPRAHTVAPARRTGWLLALFAPAPAPRARATSGGRRARRPVPHAHRRAAAPRAAVPSPGRKQAGTGNPPPAAPRPKAPPPASRAPALPRLRTARDPPPPASLLFSPLPGLPSRALNVPIS
jgi:hypothetical protein